MSRYESLTVSDYGVAPVMGMATYAAGLSTIASIGVATKLVAVTTAKGDANGLIVGIDNTFSLITGARKMLHVKGRFHVDLASAADDVTLHVYVGGASVFETAAQTLTSGTPLLFEIDVMLSVNPNTRENATQGDIEIWAENIDATANIDTIAFAETTGIVSATAATDTTVLSHGWVSVEG